jgi:hypothetical protein
MYPVNFCLIFCFVLSDVLKPSIRPPPSLPFSSFKLAHSFEFTILFSREKRKAQYSITGELSENCIHILVVTL